jgi:hypothetical protein
VLILVLAAPHEGRPQEDMTFVLPVFVTDEVHLNEGYRSAAAAARAATRRAWERTQMSSSRPDRAPEQESGSVVYHYPGSRGRPAGYGFTEPRSGIGWAAGERTDPTDPSSPYTSVRPTRGVTREGADGRWRLMTPEREDVVATYHIHPSHPLDGTPAPSGRAAPIARQSG